MSVIHGPQATPTPTATPPAATHETLATRALAVLRIAFGLTFLWAFLDKLLALGFHTGYDRAGNLDRFGDAAWIHGGSPTQGFLAFSAAGPFQGFYNSIAGATWADTLFMLGLLGIGLGLTLGLAMRLTAAAGVVMYLMMWSVVLPPQTNPLIDDHILGAITLIVLALLSAGTTWGLATRLEHTQLVRHHPALR